MLDSIWTLLALSKPGVCYRYERVLNLPQTFKAPAQTPSLAKWDTAKFD